MGISYFLWLLVMHVLLFGIWVISSVVFILYIGRLSVDMDKGLYTTRAWQRDGYGMVAFLVWFVLFCYGFGFGKSSRVRRVCLCYIWKIENMYRVCSISYHS